MLTSKHIHLSRLCHRSYHGKRIKLKKTDLNIVGLWGKHGNIIFKNEQCMNQLAFVL